MISRGERIGYFVQADFPTEHGPVPLYLGARRHESLPYPWVGREHAQLFPNAEEAIQASIVAEQQTRHRVELMPVYKKDGMGL